MKTSNPIALGTLPPQMYTHRKLSMKTQLVPAVRSIVLLAVISAGAFAVKDAAAQSAAVKPASNTSSNVQSSIRFRPPTSGAASVRVTGGSRGSGDAAVTLDVLAPDDVGLTTQEQPSLYWFQSKPAEAKFELTLLQPNKIQPLVHVKVERASKAGIQRLKLSDHGVKLSPGVEYQWVVALVTDPENRSTDLVASGVIKRVAADAGLKEKISQAASTSQAGLYAEAGIWYDALTALSDEIDAQPDNKMLRQTRAELLQQAGLKTVAQAEVPK